MTLATLFSALILAASLCQAERRPQDPTPEELAKIEAAVPKEASAKPRKPRKMLVLSCQSHDRGRFAGEKALEIMARKTRAFEFDLIRTKEEMVDVVVPEVLKKYDAVFLNNSTGGGGNAAKGKTFVENISDYVAAGGGLAGNHAATDNRLGGVFGGKGRIFYCSLGHKKEVFQRADYQRFMLDGIQFALGDIEADMTPSGPLADRGFNACPPGRRAGLFRIESRFRGERS